MKPWIRLTGMVAFAALSGLSGRPDSLRADEGQPPVEKVRTEDRVADEQEDQETKAKVLADRYHVSQEDILKLRKDDKMGWGEISHLYAISQESGQTPQTILKLRQDGMGWGQIAHQYNLNLGKLSREVHADLRAVRSEDREEHGERVEHRRMERQEERMEKPERPDSDRRIERPEGRPDRH